jgi:predicted CXXCH cytochrome family protein
MKIPVLIRIFALILSGLAFVCGNSFAQDSPSNPDQNSKYVGVEVCQGCHEDVYKSFAKSAHAETLKSKNPATRGCEGCHGPGAEHANAGDPELIERYAGVQPAVILARCDRCHESEISQAHIKAHLSCLTCHSVHHASQARPLLVKPSPELCRGCHHAK